MMKERIDKILVERGLADSRTKAQALVMSGIVLANEQRVEKSSEMFTPETAIRLKGVSEENRFASRGGLKLEKALQEFEIDANGKICLDIGASTGGFTDCLLQNGAQKVYSVDVGTNQLIWRLRNDERVKVFENVNARNLSSEDFGGVKFDVIVMDVSFISATKIFSAVTRLLDEKGVFVCLIKPQFEVGRGEVGKGGIVRENEKREKVIETVNNAALEINLLNKGVIESPITGADGNVEFLAQYVLEKP